MFLPDSIFVHCSQGSFSCFRLLDVMSIEPQSLQSFVVFMLEYMTLKNLFDSLRVSYEISSIRSRNEDLFVLVELLPRFWIFSWICIDEIQELNKTIEPFVFQKSLTNTDSLLDSKSCILSSYCVAIGVSLDDTAVVGTTNNESCILDVVMVINQVIVGVASCWIVGIFVIGRLFLKLNWLMMGDLRWCQQRKVCVIGIRNIDRRSHSIGSIGRILLQRLMETCTVGREIMVSSIS